MSSCTTAKGGCSAISIRESMFATKSELTPARSNLPVGYEVGTLSPAVDRTECWVRRETIGISSCFSGVHERFLPI